MALLLALLNACSDNTYNPGDSVTLDEGRGTIQETNDPKNKCTNEKISDSYGVSIYHAPSNLGLRDDPGYNTYLCVSKNDMPDKK